jgi:hypothetical protein
MYKRALCVAPSHADTLSNYAQLLLDRGGGGGGGEEEGGGEGTRDAAAAAAESMWSSVLRCDCPQSVPDVHRFDCSLCHRPTLARLLLLRNISLQESSESEVDAQD